MDRLPRRPRDNAYNPPRAQGLRLRPPQTWLCWDCRAPVLAHDNPLRCDACWKRIGGREDIRCQKSGCDVIVLRRAPGEMWPGDPAEGVIGGRDGLLGRFKARCPACGKWTRLHYDTKIQPRTN